MKRKRSRLLKGSKIQKKCYNSYGAKILREHFCRVFVLE